MFEDMVTAILNQTEKPKEALQENIKSLLQGWFEKHQLVTREMLDIQQKKIDRMEVELAALEERIQQLI